MIATGAGIPLYFAAQSATMLLARNEVMHLILLGWSLLMFGYCVRVWVGLSDRQEH